MRDEAAGAEATALAGRGHQRHFGVVLMRDIAQAHARRDLATQGLDAGLEVGVGIEFGHALVPGAAQVAGAEHHQRHPIVNAGHVNFERFEARQFGRGLHTNAIEHLTGGQQAGTDRTRSVQKVDGDGRRRPRRTIDTGIALVLHIAPLRPQRRAHRDVALHVGVEGQHTKGAGVALCLQQARLQGKGHHAGEHVAAVGRGVHGVLVGLQLSKQEVQVHAGLGTAAHDGHLAGQGVSAAQTIDLTTVRRPHGRQQHPISRGGVCGQIGLIEKRPFGGAASHEETGNGDLLHGQILGRSPSSRAGVWMLAVIQ